MCGAIGCARTERPGGRRAPPGKRPAHPPVSFGGGAAAAAVPIYILITYVLGVSTTVCMKRGRETVRMNDLMVDGIVITYPTLIAIDFYCAPLARCRRAATPHVRVRMRRSGICDLAVRPRAPRE